MDQYDNPMARYSLVLDDAGRVIGGARAMSTDVNWGEHTYMLKDAMKGKLATIPDTIMDSVVDSPKVWECTRLVMCPTLDSNAKRMACLGMIVEGLIDLAQAEGAERLMSLSNLWVLRALRRLGYGADYLGKPYQNGDDGHTYAVIGIPALHAHHDDPSLQKTAA